MAEAPLVELVDVEKRYANGTLAVSGFNATFRQGEFVSLVGPSGCGKSSILRLVAGLSAPTRGTVRRLWEVEAAAQAGSAVSCVFQDPTLLPWANVWNNVRLPLQLRGVIRSESAAAVSEALGLVGLGDFASAYPRELSGGMRMRVSIARALVTRPQLLLLDEPFAALDEITRGKLNDDLRRLWQQRGWTVLFITHSMFESVFLSTRVLVMSARPGRVLEEVAIKLPVQRTLETRTTPEYAALCRQVSQALERSSTDSPEESRA